MSATNSAIFSTSRSLYSLAQEHHAPAHFRKLSNKAVPNAALQFSSLILLVVVILNYLMPAGIFEVISGVSTINFIFVWIFIAACHLRYRRKHPEGVPEFTLPGYPVTDWATIIFFAAILVILIFIPSTLISLVVSVIFIIALFVSYGFTSKTKKQN